MKLTSVSCVFFLLMLVGVYAQDPTQSDCPNPVQCLIDPCQFPECNRFYNAECRPDLCLCTANFFWRGTNVTDRCDIPTCDVRMCGPNRECMEEVSPPECPPERPGCRQHLRVRCVLPPQPDRSMTCSDVNCTANMACRMRIRTEDFLPVVRCLPASRVRDCTVGTCNDGLTCRDDGSSVVCVPPQPTTCEELDCPEGYECTMDGVEVSICVPARTTCATIFCPSFIETCVEEEAGARCVLATSCEELEPGCNANSLLCEDEETGPRCVLARSCEELQPICSASNTECRSLNGTLFFCGSPSTCAGFECDESDRCIVVQGFASCTPAVFGLTCEELKCPPEQNRCLITTVPSQNASLATCVSEEIATALNSQRASCETFGELTCNADEMCVDLVEDGKIVSPFCTLLNCDADEQCQNESVCVINPNIMLADSACIPSDVDITFGTNCTAREEGCGTASCLEVTLPSMPDEKPLGSFCSSSLLRPMSCDSFECEEVEVCATTQIGTNPERVSAFCIDPEVILNTILLLLAV